MEFTAKIEEDFDKIAEGEEKWKDVIRRFYDPFAVTLDRVEKELEHVQLEPEVSDVPCEKCGRMMVIKYGRFGKFLACPGYPECKNTKPLVQTIDVPCPVCGGKVQIRKTKRGKNYYICENNKGVGQGCNFISWNKPKPREKFDPEAEKKQIKKKTTRKSSKRSATKKTTKSTTKKSSKN